MIIKGKSDMIINDDKPSHILRTLLNYQHKKD